MNAATATLQREPTSSRALSRQELRILSGRLAGKAFPLDGRAKLQIGHNLANDVVLRGAETRDCTVELALDGDAATLGVVSGRIELLGRTLEAGEQVILPPYLPFRLGEYLVAHGARLSARWADAAAGTGQSVTEGEWQAPGPLDQWRSRARGWLARVDRGMLRGAAAVGCLGLLIAALAQPLGQIVQGGAPDANGLRQQLRQAGFTGVSVAQTTDGTLAVTGVVRDQEEMNRLGALVAQRDPDALVDAQTGAALASAATDVLQAQGVAARIAPGAPGTLVATAGYIPADRQDQLRTILRRDMPTVRQLSFRIDDGLSASPLQTFFTRSGAGLATVVGSPAHIVTADGSHWFPGAVLPTGHRLVSVTPTAVVFEKDGRAEQIRL